MSNPEKWGRWVESAVGSHLLNHALSDGYELFYWREGDREVDFVMSYKEMIISIEVKSGAAHGISGMTAFSKRFNPHKTYLIEKTSLSWQEFIKIRPVELF